MKINNHTYFILAGLILAGCTGNIEVSLTDTVNENGRNDAWGYVGFGGGGAMFHPEVSPHDPNLVFVACDMTGSYVSRDAGLAWRMFNLRGPVDYFVFDPSDPQVVYAKSIGLFRSADQGNTWTLFYPSSAEVAGLVSRGDHANEAVVTKDSTRRDVEAFAIDPADSKRLYAVISIDGRAGFYTSQDAGVRWKRETEVATGAQKIFIVPTSPIDDRTIVIAGKTGTVNRENGEWKTNPPPSDVKQLTKVAGGFDTKTKRLTLYAITGVSYFNPAGDPPGIYYSIDGGVSWENRQQGLTAFACEGAPIPEWRTIATSADHPEVVYVSYNNLKIHRDTTCLGVARSDDFGKTWKLVWKDHLSQGGDVAADNYESGWINERFGPSWGENPFSLGVSASDPNVCYGTDFGRTTRTVDGGATWKQVYTKKSNSGRGWISRGLEVTTSYAVVFDPFDLQHVFIANTDVGLMESTDGGISWSSATRDNGIPRPWINSTYWLTFDPEVKGRAWAAMSGTHDLPRPKMFRRNGTAGYKGGIVHTEDGGKTWTPVSADIGEAAVTHVLIDQESNPESRTLYACAFGKGVYKSTNGGKSWQKKNTGIEGHEPFAWRIVQRAHDNALFLVVCRRSEDGSIGNSGDGALYRSDDGAESWTKISMPHGTNGPMSIAVSDDHPSRLLLSAWGRRAQREFFPDTGGGIFVSDDDGKTWSQTLAHDQHIHDLTFDPRTRRYYSCGFNGSAYYSADAGETWQRLGGYNFKWGKRVDVDPRNPENIFIVTFGGGVWYGPADGDPAAVEDVVPPLH